MTTKNKKYELKKFNNNIVKLKKNKKNIKKL